MKFTHCIDCARPFRKWNQPYEEAPDTVRPHAGGRCSGCYSRHKDGRPTLAEEAQQAIPEEETRHAHYALQAFLNDRRRRLQRKATA